MTAAATAPPESTNPTPQTLPALDVATVRSHIGQFTDIIDRDEEDLATVSLGSRRGLRRCCHRAAVLMVAVEERVRLSASRQPSTVRSLVRVSNLVAVRAPRAFPTGGCRVMLR